MRRFAQVFVLVALAAVGIAAGAVLAPGGSASSSAPAATTTGVTVTATEFKFKLSRTNVPTGTVIFTVVNKGKIAHDFKIAGKKTPTLSPGKSFKLTVKFTKSGKFAYLCTLLGHAKAGMKGILQVGTTPVTVTATEFKFKLSRLSVPIGPVTFTVINKGKIAHDFKIAGKKTPTLSPGKSFKLNVTFSKKGRYAFLCTLLGHAGAGMKGTFSVAAPPVTTPPPTHDDAHHDHDAASASDRNGRHGCDHGSGEHDGLRVHHVAVDHPLGPGHVRDQEQRQRRPQLRYLGRQVRRHPLRRPVGDVDGRSTREAAIPHRLRRSVPRRSRHEPRVHRHTLS